MVQKKIVYSLFVGHAKDVVLLGEGRIQGQGFEAGTPGLREQVRGVLRVQIARAASLWFKGLIVEIVNINALNWIGIR